MVLCAGSSARFGADKMLSNLRGKPVVSHLLARLETQTETLAINAVQSAEYQGFGFPVIEDCLVGGFGPLVGVLSAMKWAADKGHTHVLTCAGDTPFVPADWATRLYAQTGEGIVVSRSRGRAHYICALWPVDLAAQLEQNLQNGLRGVGKWIAGQDNISVEFALQGEIDPFFNINTMADLAEAERLLSLAACH